MLYFIFTTGQCNLTCQYCGGSFPQKLVPWTVEYPIACLKRFISDDPQAILAFYGGEPLLNANFIREVMDQLPDVKFVIQTNGVLRENLESRYWSQFDAILLSVDGNRTVTDYYRGAQIYDPVLLPQSGCGLKDLLMTSLLE